MQSQMLEAVFLSVLLTGRDAHDCPPARALCVAQGHVIHEAVDDGEPPGLVGEDFAPFAVGLIGSDEL